MQPGSIVISNSIVLGFTFYNMYITYHTLNSISRITVVVTFSLSRHHYAPFLTRYFIRLVHHHVYHVYEVSYQKVLLAGNSGLAGNSAPLEMSFLQVDF